MYTILYFFKNDFRIRIRLPPALEFCEIAIDTKNSADIAHRSLSEF